MSEHESQIHQIEMSIEVAKKRIEDADCLDRLYKNEDFKKIFVEGYFRDEASRTVLLKADPNMQGTEEQKNCDNVILAIGHLYQHFAKIFALGTMSKNAIEQDRQTREEILAEAGNDDNELAVVRVGSLQ